MVNTQDFIKTLSLQVLTPAPKEELDIQSVELNRPGLQFVGFYKHFAYERPQVVGKAERAYLMSLARAERVERLRALFQHGAY